MNFAQSRKFRNNSKMMTKPNPKGRRKNPDDYEEKIYKSLVLMVIVALTSLATPSGSLRMKVVTILCHF